MTKVFFVFFALFLVLVSPVFAQEDTQPDILSVSPAVVSPIPTPDYSLPYPGILPGNPLYFLKAARDRMVSMLIGDPLKKAEFDLLQADKRLNAAAFLAKKDTSDKTVDLVVSTISKGENYFEEAIAKTIEANKEGRDVSDFARKMLDSSQKHKSVIKDIQKRGSSKMRKDTSQLLQRMEEIEKRVKELLPKEKQKDTSAM